MGKYLETIEVYDIKFGIYSNLNEYMEIYMYKRSRSFFDLCSRSHRFHLFQTAFALKPLDRLTRGKSHFFLPLPNPFVIGSSSITIFKHGSSDTAGPVKVKFSCRSWGLSGHMAKMTTMQDIQASGT